MEIVSPHSLTEALDGLATDPGMTVVAGGTDVMVGVNFGRERPRRMMSLRRLSELRKVEVGDTVYCGAGVTYSQMVAKLSDPALMLAARSVGSPQIRNAGTLGGNLGTCSPAGDSLPALSALDATIEVASATAHREISVHDFMVGVKRTALAPGELVVAATVPVVNGYQGFAKV